MKPTTNFEWACYNAAHLRHQIYGGMSFLEVSEYIAGKHGKLPGEAALLMFTWSR